MKKHVYTAPSIESINYFDVILTSDIIDKWDDYENDDELF